ncbi:MAG: hypothetical protein ACK2UW_16945 [Anaerolineales bacterium]
MTQETPPASPVEDPVHLPARLPWAWYPWVGFAAGIGLLAVLYFQAAQGPVPYLFGLFWLGIFLFFIPTFWRLLSDHIGRIERVSLLGAAALFSYLPKLLRCPSYFCYSDELTWWRGVQNLVNGSPLLSNNPLGEVQGAFPGLPAITFVLQRASGLSTFQVGLILMGCLHLLVLISIFMLGEKIFHSEKAGAIAAMVYLANPDFFYFNTQFSYESLSVPIILLTLVFIQFVLAEPENRVSRAWTVVIFINIATIVVVHHLSAFMLIAMLTLMVLAAVVLPRKTWLIKSARLLNFITIFAYAATLAWLAVFASDVFAYLSDPFIRGFGGITSVTVRKLFGGITLPVYEVASGYLAAILVGLLGIGGAALIIRVKNVRYAAQIGLLAFGSLYFLSAPLVLTTWGSESGRRSWTYSFISLALLAGFALAWLARQNSIGKLKSAYLGRSSAALALVLLLMGGIASSTSISYRFPGGYLQNSDARSYTPEIIGAAHWMLSQVGLENRVLGDRTTERIFGSYGLQEPAMLGGPRPWEVFLPTTWTAEAQYYLQAADAPFIVVDKRMAELPPQMDTRFQRGEPPLAYSDRPLPVESILKFDDLASLDRIFDSGNIRIYALNEFGQSLQAVDRDAVHPALQMQSAAGDQNETPPIYQPLFTLLRALLLIVLFLFIPGWMIGKRFFPDWVQLDGLVQSLLAVAISFSLIILSTVIFALIFADVWLAATITIVLIAVILVLAFVQLVLRIPEVSFEDLDAFGRLQQLWERLRSSGALTALISGSLGVLLLVLAMGRINQGSDPRTVFALDLSSDAPAVQVINDELGDQIYRIKIRSSANIDWPSQPIRLNPGESTTLEIPAQVLTALSPGKLYLDLYRGDDQAPYRSLHFLPENTRSDDRSLLHQNQIN